MRSLSTTFLRIAAITALACITAPANAGIMFDSTGGGGPGIEIDTLDPAPGNALAVGAITAVTSGPGSTFDLFYQAQLAALFNNGSNVTPANLGAGGTAELTFVAGLTERVAVVIPLGGGASTAVFDLAPSSMQTVNYFEVYWQDPKDASDLAGTGFNNGTLILAGTIISSLGNFTTTTTTGNLDQFGANDYPGQLTITGVGATSLVARVNFADPGFFILDPGTEIGLSLFNTSQILPFNQADPSAAFVTTTGPAGSPQTTALGEIPVLAGAGSGSLGAINGVSGPDFQFQADGNAILTVVPEPSSLLLCGLGAIGLIGRGIRRRRTASQIAA